MKNLDLEVKWAMLTDNLANDFGKKPDLNAVLFLIGIDELGRTPWDFSKEEKQDLMHVAMCKVLSYTGYYELNGYDDEGWPHYTLKQKLPTLTLLAQEELIKAHVIHHFETIGLLKQL